MRPGVTSPPATSRRRTRRAGESVGHDLAVDVGVAPDRQIRPAPGGDRQAGPPVSDGGVGLGRSAAQAARESGDRRRALEDQAGQVVLAAAVRRTRSVIGRLRARRPAAARAPEAARSRAA